MGARGSALRGITANVGWLGLQHVLENGGFGYFPEQDRATSSKSKATEFDRKRARVFDAGLRRLSS
jgi:hypothetical protein